MTMGRKIRCSSIFHGVITGRGHNVLCFGYFMILPIMMPHFLCNKLIHYFVLRTVGIGFGQWCRLC
jgi:hypothetical protein